MLELGFMPRQICMLPVMRSIRLLPLYLGVRYIHLVGSYWFYCCAAQPLPLLMLLFVPPGDTEKSSIGL